MSVCVCFCFDPFPFFTYIGNSDSFFVKVVFFCFAKMLNTNYNRIFTGLLKRIFAAAVLIANCLTERQFRKVKYLEEIVGFLPKERQIILSAIELHFPTISHFPNCTQAREKTKLALKWISTNHLCGKLRTVGLATTERCQLTHSSNFTHIPLKLNSVKISCQIKVFY